MKRLIKINTIVILNLVLLCLFMSGAAQAIIIDHNCTDVSQIPEYWINQVKNMVSVHTGQSHGRQVPRGLEELELIDNTYDAEISTEDIPQGTNVLKVSRALRTLYNGWMYGVGPEQYWSTEGGLNNVRRTLDYHANNEVQVDAILHTWCWHFRTWSEAQVNDYFAALGTLEAEYPNVTFIYMTDTADYTGDYGYNRWQRNEQVRQYCRDNNKMLFDFGELETWSEDGTEQNTYYHSGSGQTIPLWHSDVSTGAENYYGHINRTGATIKAKAMWWLLARIVGWDGVAEDGYILNITIAGSGQVTKTPDQATYNSGDTVTLEAFPDSGHVFASWNGDLTGNTNPIDITMDSNKFVTANFAPESAQAPVAVITANPTSGEAPLAVNFDGSSSFDPDGNIVSYEWDFENAGVIDAQGVTVSYTYDTQGTYTARLIVTDSQGLSDTATTTITVNAKTPDTNLFDDWKLNCYNNVFNPLKGEEAIIEVTLKEQGMVSVVLYNTRGQEIKKLVDKEEQPDTYKYYWDGKDGSENVVGSGLYFVHIQAGDYKKTKKIVVVK